jgi:hypothetical protein
MGHLREEQKVLTRKYKAAHQVLSLRNRNAEIGQDGMAG